MAWSDSTQKVVFPVQRRECGYGTFSATGTTLNIYTFLSNIHSILVGYRSSGNSCIVDEPLTASETITTGYFVVTRPSSCGAASTVWYMVIGE